jgi:N-acyl-D-amino-acid deacylase
VGHTPIKSSPAANRAPEGINITADVYPYTMWNSTPRVLFPKKDFDNLASAEFATRELFDPAASVMVRYSPNRAWQGKTVTEIATLNNESPAQGLLRIIRESAAPGQGATIVAKSMSETDISNFIKWPYSSICTDGTMSGHPRGHGAFTRVLGRYVREQKLMPLETAIQKMTSLAAENAGIKNRGVIAPGYFADLVLFDPETIIDNATIENPTALSTGVHHVWVNGKLVYNDMKAVPNFSGRFVKRN